MFGISSTSSRKPKPKSLFKKVGWPDSYPRVIDRSVENAHDISRGLHLILQVLERDEMSLECEMPTLFNDAERCELLRLAIASSDLLSSALENDIGDRRVGVVQSASE